MPDNFYITAERCLNAAVALNISPTDHKHLACYLSGYVAECAAKQIIMVVFSASPKDIKKAFSHGLTALSDWIQLIALDPAGHSIPLSHLPDFHSDAAQILAKWNPNNRYSNSCGWDGACSTNFIGEATSIMTKLAQLRASGII